MLLLTLRGAPTLYYGDELGVGRVEIPPNLIRDPWAIREPHLRVGRDPSRTPMQWDKSDFAGFSTHEPWLPLTPDHAVRNVAVMRNEATSMLVLVRNLLHYRRKCPSLSCGAWRLLSQENDVLAYERSNGQSRVIVVLNFAAEPRVHHFNPPTELRIAISTHGDRQSEKIEQNLNLGPNEGLVIEQA